MDFGASKMKAHMNLHNKLFNYISKASWYTITNAIDDNDDLLIDKFWTRLASIQKHIK
jgi:hypothetical protein